MKNIQITFGVDFDSVAGWIGSYGGENSPSDIQRGIFAAEVGVPRLLKLFEREGIQASWFIPGHSLESFPEECAMVAAAGHEIGAHGYTHENPIRLARGQEADILDKSVELIRNLTGRTPAGYVAPWWEMSANTIDLLVEAGFVYDHSQSYRDFEPHYARGADNWVNIDYANPAATWMHPLRRGAATPLVEIGANWYLDDLPPMMFIKASPNSHGFVDPRVIESLWRDQFDWVYREYEQAVFPITIHPDVSGRPQVLLMLERLLSYVRGFEGVSIVPMEQVARDFMARNPFGASAGVS